MVRRWERRGLDVPGNTVLLFLYAVDGCILSQIFIMNNMYSHSPGSPSQIESLLKNCRRKWTRRLSCSTTTTDVSCLSWKTGRRRPGCSDLSSSLSRRRWFLTRKISRCVLFFYHITCHLCQHLQRLIKWTQLACFKEKSFWSLAICSFSAMLYTWRSEQVTFPVALTEIYLQW